MMDVHYKLSSNTMDWASVSFFVTLGDIFVTVG